MIFDSDLMRTLRQKWAHEPVFRVPQIVLLDRSQDLEMERAYLESLLATAPAHKQADWLSRLINGRDEQHLGAWFEVMLYGWLQSVGSVTVEPDIEGDRPDYLVSIGTEHLVVEARAMVVDSAQRQREKWQAEMRWLLEQIPRPYVVVVVKPRQMKDRIAPKRFQLAITNWLDHSAGERFVYEDNHQNTIELTAEPDPRATHVRVVQTEMHSINPALLRPRLREKANQHRRLREARHPYVIALMLESPLYSAEEVIEAWIGSLVYSYDADTGTFLGADLDGKGLHFGGKVLQHRSVSGTLVCRPRYDPLLGRRDLEVRYVENPYATIKIDPYVFPAISRYVVLSESERGYQMVWQSKRSETDR